MIGQFPDLHVAAIMRPYVTRERERDIRSVMAGTSASIAATITENDVSKNHTITVRSREVRNERRNDAH